MRVTPLGDSALLINLEAGDPQEGAALAQRGWRVALIERGILRGRDQEWNISRHELQVLLDLELLTR